ncbi:MAG: ATP phosphoribosyltransferase [Planctomycetales bacterium]|nr:ATP phosphoribosyltransferase [Planctomycetales bacterium]
MLKLGLPKGSLEEATVSLFARAGWAVTSSSRSYTATVDDPDLHCRWVRPQEMARYVEAGVLDAGLTGEDWLLESGCRTRVVAPLVYSKQLAAPVRWVLAVPEDSPVRKPADLEGKRVSTELVRVASDWLARLGVRAKVEFSWGATEAKVPDLADAIVEVTETGSSLRANRLRVVETVMTSRTVLICNEAAWADPSRRQKLDTIALLLQGAIAAREKVGLKMNIHESRLQALLALLPSMRSPTVSPLSGTGWHAVEIMVDEKTVRDLIPRLKAAGAEGIVEYPLNKVVP